MINGKEIQMKETKILVALTSANIWRQLKQLQNASGHKTKLCDIPGIESELNSYLSQGWSISEFTGDGSQLCILLTR